jgi:hypothetical protein
MRPPDLPPLLSRRASNLPPSLNGAIFPPAAGHAAHRAWRALVEDASHHLHPMFYIRRDDGPAAPLTRVQDVLAHPLSPLR